MKFFFGDCVYIGQGVVLKTFQKAPHPSDNSRINGWLLDRRRQNNWQNFFFSSCLFLTYYGTLWYCFVSLTYYAAVDSFFLTAKNWADDFLVTCIY